MCTSHCLAMALVLWSVIVGAAPTGPPFLRLEPGGKAVTGAVSPDLRRYYLGQNDRTIRILEMSQHGSTQTIRLPSGPGSYGTPTAIAVSGDDRFLAVACATDHNTVRVYDAPSRRLVRVLDARGAGALSFSGDSSLLAMSGTTQLWRAGSWEEITPLPGAIANTALIALSPSGRSLATMSADGGIWLWPTAGGEPVAVGRASVQRSRLRWSPGDRYLSWCVDNMLSVLDVPSRQVVRQLPTLPTRFGNFESDWGPDGKSFWVLQRHGADLKLDCVDVVTGATLQSMASAEAHRIFTSALGDRLLGLADGLDQLLEVPSGRELWRMPYQYRTADVGWSADSSRIGWRRIAFGVPDAVPDTKALVVTSMSPEVTTVNPATWSPAVHDQAGQRLEVDGNDLLVRPAAGNVVRLPGAGGCLQYTFTPAGEILVTLWSSIRLYRPDGTLRAELDGNGSYLYATAVSPDGRYVLGGSADATIRVWPIQSDATPIPPLLNLYMGGDENWVAWTDAGYYACSPGAEQWIGWQINQGDAEPLYYRATQFRDKLYRPDIIRRVLKCGSVTKAVEEADAERNQTTDAKLVASQMAAFVPPDVEITAPSANAVFRENKIMVRAKLHDPNGRKISATQVMVNGRPPWQGRFIFVPVRGPEEYGGPAELVPGENVITVTATNDAGAQSAPVSVTVRYEAAAADAIKPALYVLAVGVGDYAKPEYKLALAGKDAKDFAAAYQSQAGKLFHKVDVKLLTDGEASGGNILDGLDWLSKQVTQRDYAVVYLAGHGLPDAKGDFYFLPSDGDAEKLLRTGVSWQAIRGVLKNLPGKVLLFLDACHSGGAAGTRLVGRLDYTNALRDAATDEVGVITLASCMPSEVSYERPEWGNGAFTKALVEGLGGKADLSGDGVISVAELDAFVAERVKELTEGRQHPTTQRPTTIRSSLPVAATR